MSIPSVHGGFAQWAKGMNRGAIGAKTHIPRLDSTGALLYYSRFAIGTGDIAGHTMTRDPGCQKRNEAKPARVIGQNAAIDGMR